MKKQKEKVVSVKFNWFDILTGIFSIISIFTLLLVVFIYVAGFDDGDIIATLYSFYFIYIQIFISAVTFFVSIYMLTNTKRVKNIKKEDRKTVYVNRFIFLAISILISLLIAAVLSRLVYLYTISHESTLGFAVILPLYYIIIASFVVLAIHIPSLASCFLADKYYCKKKNTHNTKVNK